MRCPFCGTPDSKVIDSRSKSDGKVVRRRRECIACKRRFTTKEYVEENPILVIKCDQRREAFNREKLKQGVLLACTKRPISMAQIDALVSHVENTIKDQSREEVTSKEIGEMVMEQLKKLDQVAYVRFASVYRNFQAMDEFLHEIQGLK